MSSEKPQSAASRMAAARLERSQLRANAARTTNASSSQYGAFYGSSAPVAAPPGGDARSKSVDLTAAGGNPSGESSSAAGGYREGALNQTLAEIGVPVIPLSSSEAFGVASKEGALHENHDRGAAAVLPDIKRNLINATLGTSTH